METNRLAPVALFVYNRPIHTQKTIEALQANFLSTDSDLYIFSDGFKNTDDKGQVIQVREIIRKTTGFKNVKIFERESNIGLANSIIGGVTEIINQYNKIIVLEDDIVTSRNFLTYMNTCLDFFENQTDIYSVTGFNIPIKVPAKYSLPIYLSKRPSSWGWATWKNRWEHVDWEVKDFNVLLKNKKIQKKFNEGGDDLFRMLKQQQQGQINSWAIRWAYHHFINKGYCIFPVVSKLNNIGTDNSGVHFKKSTKKYYVEMDKSDIPIKLIDNIRPDYEMELILRTFYKYNIFKKFKMGIRNWFNI